MHVLFIVWCVPVLIHACKPNCPTRTFKIIQSNPKYSAISFFRLIDYSINHCSCNKCWYLWVPVFISGVDSDIIDEAIYYFKANVFFKNYEIKVIYNFPLVYLTKCKINMYAHVYVFSPLDILSTLCACSCVCFSLHRLSLFLSWSSWAFFFFHMSQLASSSSCPPQLCIHNCSGFKLCILLQLRPGSNCRNYCVIYKLHKTVF